MKYFEGVKSLFTEYNSELRSFVNNKLGNISDSEEIVQDTFHNLISSGKSDEIENPRAYLYKTANNLALNYIRSNKYRAEYISNSEILDSTPSLEQEIFAQDDIRRLQAKLDSWPSKTKKIFLLNRVDGKTYMEISSELEMSESSVQKHMMKAIKLIRAHLSESP